MFHNRIFTVTVLVLVIHGELTNVATGQKHSTVFAIGSSTDADSAMTEQAYLEKLQAADATTFKRDFESYFLLLLDPEQKSVYDSLQSLDEKKAFVERYWKGANPNPLLPENDWLLEFNRRVRYAKKNFRRASPPYVDDRGLYYIKFGKPRTRYENMGDWDIAPHEVWSYEAVQRNFVLYFVKEGIGYREIADLTDIVVHGTPKNEVARLWLWSALVKKVRHVSPLLGEAASKIEFLEEAIAYAKNHPNARSVFAEELNAPHGIIATIDKDFKIEKQKARIAAPWVARDPFVAKNEIEFFDQIAQFRGPGRQTRIEIAMLAPLKKNLVKQVKESSKDTVEVEFSGGLRDAYFEPIIKERNSTKLLVGLAAQTKLPNAVGKLALPAAPQETELTLQVKEKQSEKIGFYRQPLRIRDFSSENELLISDIQVNYRVRNDVQKKILPTLQNQDMAVSPYPYHEINRKQPPLVYFEIYNIRRAGIQEEVQISYSIAPIKNDGDDLQDLMLLGEASVSVSYARLVTGDNMQERVEIDLKNVKKGWNLLEVTISSLRDSTKKATVQKRLFVKE